MNKFFIRDETQYGTIRTIRLSPDGEISYGVDIAPGRKMPSVEMLEGKVKREFREWFFRTYSKEVDRYVIEERFLEKNWDTSLGYDGLHLPIGQKVDSGVITGVYDAVDFLKHSPQSVSWEQEFPGCFSPGKFVYAVKLNNPQHPCSLEVFLDNYPFYTEEFATKCWESEPLKDELTVPEDNVRVVNGE